MKKPKKEDYGWLEKSGYDGEPGGWVLEGGEDAYFEALKKWEGTHPVILYKYTYQEVYNQHSVDFEPVLKSFEIIKETTFGYWIKLYSKKDKFVLKEGKNIYARTTKQRALQDFIIKKKKQITILKNNAEKLENMLKKIKDEK